MSEYDDILNGVLSSGEAANLVESLQSQLAAMTEKRDEWRGRCESATTNADALSNEKFQAERERDQVTKERDEALSTAKALREAFTRLDPSEPTEPTLVHGKSSCDLDCLQMPPAPSQEPERTKYQDIGKNLPGDEPESLPNTRTVESQGEDMTFEKELESLINRHSKENESNTPDYILAQYLLGCLSAFTQASQQRDNWHGRDPRPSQSAPKKDSGKRGTK